MDRPQKQHAGTAGERPGRGIERALMAKNRNLGEADATQHLRLGRADGDDMVATIGEPRFLA